jgi:hypothetical protein
MFNKFFFSVFLLLVCTNSFAQNKVNFEIILSDNKVTHSLYNSITLADARADTSSFGIVQTGVLNRNGWVVSEKPFSDELKRILSSLTDTTAAKGELLLQLRRLNFAEVTGAIGENGYCAFRAEMYAMKGNAFYKINSIDTLLHLRSSIDVTNKTLRSGSLELTAFIRSSLLLAPANDAVAYTANDIAHIDSVEKATLKLYTTSVYTDGLYLTYQSFKNQVPDVKILSIPNDYIYPGNVMAPNEKGKLKEVKLKKTYAIVYKGVPYIATEYGFYLLTKQHLDFTFTGIAKTPPTASSVMISSALFGILGAMAASAGDEGTYEMKIDHKNGSAIKLREIPAPKATGTSRNDGWD